MNKRIVVTGMGALTPLGCGVEQVWQRLLAGQSGIRRLPEELIGDLPISIGGQVPDRIQDPQAGFDPDALLAPKEQRKMDRFILFALAAAQEALTQPAGLRRRRRRRNVPPPSSLRAWAVSRPSSTPCAPPTARGRVVFRRSPFHPSSAIWPPVMCRSSMA